MSVLDNDHTLLGSFSTADMGTGWHLLKVQAEGTALRFFGEPRRDSDGFNLRHPLR